MLFFSPIVKKKAKNPVKKAVKKIQREGMKQQEEQKSSKGKMVWGGIKAHSWKFYLFIFTVINNGRISWDGTAYSLGAFLIAICLKVITALPLWLLLACDIILSFM